MEQRFFLVSYLWQADYYEELGTAIYKWYWLKQKV